MIMLFPKGDPREAYVLADADQEKALRAQGYLPLSESGMHPDQFRVEIGDVLIAPDGSKFKVVAEVTVSEPPAKRGPGRPKKG